MPNEGDSNARSEVARVGLKLPPFWDKQPELWFANIESQFNVSGITQDATQYHSVVMALNCDISAYVSDIILQPPTENKYQTLKARLIADFSDSEQRRIKAVLSELSLGDDKPSHLLRRMKQLAGKTIGDDFLRTLWLQRLTPQTQAILSVSDDAVEKLAILADKIHETTSGQVDEVRSSAFLRSCTPQSSSQPSFPGMSELYSVLAELKTEIKNLSKQRGRSQSRGRPDRSRSRKRKDNSPDSETNGQCWYHRKFGKSANRCRSPCTWQKQGN